MLWWYDPLVPHTADKNAFVHAPAIDCHTGAVPDLGAYVDVDHWVMYGSPYLRTNEQCPRVEYRDQLPNDLAPYLPDRVIGKHFSGRMQNGDFIGVLQTLREGNVVGIERLSY